MRMIKELVVGALALALTAALCASFSSCASGEGDRMRGDGASDVAREVSGEAD